MWHSLTNVSSLLNQLLALLNLDSGSFYSLLSEINDKNFICQRYHMYFTIQQHTTKKTHKTLFKKLFFIHHYACHILKTDVNDRK